MLLARFAFFNFEEHKEWIGHRWERLWGRRSRRCRLISSHWNRWPARVGRNRGQYSGSL